MRYVMLYRSADDIEAKAAPHFPAHAQRLREFHERGELLMAGPFEDPQGQGSMSIFISREAAEAFAAGDPFVLNGVVADYEIRGWAEGLDER